MEPSTTAAPSTYSPPASSMSGASAGKPEERRPRSSPSAAGTCGPWQSVPTGLSSAKKCSTMRRTSGSTLMYSGARPAGNHDGREGGGIDVGERDVDRARAPRLLHVRVEVRLEVVHDELDRPSAPRRTARARPRRANWTYIVSRSSAASPARIKTLAMRRGYSTVTVFARFRGWSTFSPRRRAIRYARSCSGRIASTTCRKAGVFGT